jgi:hypothetical protein
VSVAASLNGPIFWLLIANLVGTPEDRHRVR